MAVPLLVIAASGMNLFVTIERVSDDKVWNSDSDTFTSPGVDVPNERINLTEGTGNRLGSYTGTMNSSGISANTTAGGAYRIRVHDDDDANDKTVSGDIKYEVDGVECTAADVVKWRGGTPDGLQNGLVPVEVQEVDTATLTDIATAVWEEPIGDHNGVSGSTAEYLYNIGNEFGNIAVYVWEHSVASPAASSYGELVNNMGSTVSTYLDASVASRATPSDVSSSVWDAAISSYNTSGSFGEFLQTYLIGIESNTTLIIGNVGTVDGTVNSIYTIVNSNLDTTVSSRAAPSDVASSVWDAGIGSYTSGGSFGEFVQNILPIKVMNTSVAAVASHEAIVQGGLAEMSLRTMSSEVDGTDFIVYALDGTTVLFTYTITRTPGALPVTKILV